MPSFSEEDFLREQAQPMPAVITADLAGKTIIVTGANSGLGLEASKHFARMNPGRLIIVCRNVTKGEQAVIEIKNETGFDRAEPWVMELGDFSTIKSFADRAEKELDRIDCLVENAAVSNGGKYLLTSDGWEQELQINSLGPTLLALLLLPKMMETAEKYNTYPRLIAVSSNVHHWATIDKSLVDAQNPLQMYSSEEYCTESVMGTRYISTKLLNLLSIRALHARLPEASPTVTVVAVNPGFCLSSLRRNLPQGRKAYWGSMEKFAYTSEQGSRTLIYGVLGRASTEEEEKKMRGSYTSLCELSEVSDWVLSEDGKKAEDRFWNETVKVLSETDNRVHRIVSKYLRA